MFMSRCARERSVRALVAGTSVRATARMVDGDIWTFTAIDADSKLMISWLVGQRNSETANLEEILALMDGEVRVGD